LQEPHRLEEVELLRLAEQLPAQISTLSPSLGGHARSTSSPFLIRATSFVKELIVQYRPRNRSSTEANGNRPLLVYLSSSKTSRTSTPRQMVSPPARPTTRRLATPRRPSMTFFVSAESAKS